MDELFAKAPIKKVYFKLALPVVLDMMTTMLYNLIDTFFVAQTGDTNLIAGVTIGAPLFTFLIAISDIFGLGGSSVVSRLFGQKKNNLGKCVSSFSIWGGIFAGLLITAILLIFQRPILIMLGAKTATYADATAFYKPIAIGASLIVVAVIPQNLIRTEGLAFDAMLTSISGTILTIILDPIFLFVLHMGAFGVALANVLGYVLEDAYMAWVILKRAQYVNFNPSLVKISGKLIKEVVAIGIPGSVTNFAQTFGMALLNASLAGYGADKVAAMGIAQKIYNIVVMVIVGFVFGAQPLIGYNYGAQNWRRLKDILHFDILVQVVYALITGGLLIIFAKPIIALFMNQANIVNAGSYMLITTTITTPLVGLIMVYTTVFQSVGKAGAAFIMSISRQGVIYFLALEALKLILGYHGIIWAQAATDILTCLLGYFIYSKSLDLKDKLRKES